MKLWDYEVVVSCGVVECWSDEVLEGWNVGVVGEWGSGGMVNKI